MIDLCFFFMPPLPLSRNQIFYFTRPDSNAICWMEPEQTAGKKLNYLFTQGQSVLNRSFFPCQDSPAVRITYTATVLVPMGYTALMVGIMSVSNLRSMAFVL